MTSADILVSICYIAHDNDTLLERAIDGFMMQKTDFEFDIIVANECVTSDALQILEKYEQGHPGKIKRISVEKSSGTLPGLISCTKLCRGKYIAFFEGDDFWSEPDKLQKQVNFLEANPEYQ